jgi:hypothetical protein
MAIPDKAVGYGNLSTARNVFGFYTSQDLSSVIRYEAYDNNETFPALESPALTTVLNDILVGTTHNSSKSMVCLVDTTNAAPSSDWKPAAATAGEANPNRLKGTTSYVDQDGAARAATERATFNMVIEVPHDVETTDTMQFELSVRYTYTGTAPAVKFQYNDGTEGSPNWVDITAGTHGIKHCRTGSSAPSNLYANIPADGTEDTTEGWVTT